MEPIDRTENLSIKAELERLRAENERLSERVARLTSVLSRQRSMLFEMDLTARPVESGILLLAGDDDSAASRLAHAIIQRLEGRSAGAEEFEVDLAVSTTEDREESWRASIWRGGRNGSLLVAARDVTRSRAHLHDLRETESLYHTLLDVLPEPVLFTDLHGELRYINPAGATLLGARQEMLTGTSIWHYVHPEDLDRLRRRARTIVRSKGVDESTLRFVRSDGDVVHVIARTVAAPFEGQPAILSAARDVTRQRRADQAARESRELLGKIFQATPVAMSIARLDDGTLLDVNTAWCDLTGFNREEAVGRPFPELSLLDKTVAGELLEKLQSEVYFSNAEIDLRRRDGEARTVVVSSQRVSASGVAASLTVASDITSRKQTELRLVEARDEAREMARIKSSFLTNMTHEIRTPLTVILGFTTMLKQGVNPAYRRFVNVIERSGRRLLLTLDSILDLAQLEAGSVQVDRLPFSVQDAIENVVDTVEPLASEKGLTIRLHRGDQPAIVAGGHKIFTRIIHHLLDNAVKFTEAGTVDVSVTVDDAREEVSVTVVDTGIGIRSEFLPHVFEEFSQESTGLERTHQGSGLGLAVSRRLAEATGGRIEVESEKGKGSTFRLTLPRATALASSEA